MKATFEGLYQRMYGMPLREIDWIVDAVCTLCREHEKAGFVEGLKVGLLLEKELQVKACRELFLRAILGI